MNRHAVILTHNRPELLVETVNAIGTQVDEIVILDNASEPPVDESAFSELVHVLSIPDQPPNIARMWNAGLDECEHLRSQQCEPWRVAFLCDDAPPPEGWFDAVTAAMEQTGAAVGCSNPFGYAHAPVVKLGPDSDIMGRMPGWAWVLDPDSGVRADESMQWWWVDTDIDFQARRAGGMVMVGGLAVPNARPGEFTNTRPELGARVGHDREAFIAKWGYAPW